MKNLILAVLTLLAMGAVGPALLVSGPQISVPELKSHYEEKRFSIVLVPGHDPVYSGTAFGGYQEAEVNLKLASYLKEY